MPVANQLHDLREALAAALAVSTETERAEAKDPTGRREKDGPGGAAERGWPVEPADIVVLDPSRPVVLSTLGDPDLARRVAAVASDPFDAVP